MRRPPAAADAPVEEATPPVGDTASHDTPAEEPAEEAPAEEAPADASTEDEASA